MIDERGSWFKCYPEKWLRVMSGMAPHVSLTYIVICLRIYEADGPCKDDVLALARRTGLAKRAVEKALERLFETGKLIKKDDGIMNPFAEKLIEARRSPNISKHAQKKAAHQKSQSDQQNLLTDIDSDSDKEERQQTSRASRVGDPTWPSDYAAQFWAKYPRKVGKGAAMRALERIYFSNKVDWDRLWCALIKFAAWSLTKEIQYVKHPATWLNAECWDDELSTGEFSNGQDRLNGSVSRAAGRLAGERIELGQRPSLIPRIESGPPRGLLPPGRSGQS